MVEGCSSRFPILFDAKKTKQLEGTIPESTKAVTIICGWHRGMIFPSKHGRGEASTNIVSLLSWRSCTVLDEKLKCFIMSSIFIAALGALQCVLNRLNRGININPARAINSHKQTNFDAMLKRKQ